MAELSALKPGDVLYKTVKRQMGNTTLSTTYVNRYEVVEVHANSVTAKVNGHQRYVGSQQIRQLRRSKPSLQETRMLGLYFVAKKADADLARQEGRLIEKSDYFLIPKQA